MAYCKICGDEERLSDVVRFWSPDDGWMAGRLCPACLEDARKRKPEPGDFAYDQRDGFLADEDDAISEIYG